MLGGKATMPKPDKVHFHVYDINPQTRQECVGLCKLEGKSASREIEKMMDRYVIKKKKSLKL